MRCSSCLTVSGLAALAGIAGAKDVVYVTDLSIYTLLAPCAASAVSYGVSEQTEEGECGPNETKLQSCICSDENRLRKLHESLATDIKYSCASSATSDAKSASLVLEQYCNPSTTITFATPTNIVNAYITDLSQLDYLPSCVQGGVAEAVMGQTLDRCPTAASLLAPCVCSKSDVVKDVSSMISSSVRYDCSNAEDVTVGYGFYNDYCALNEGTTKFATPKGPPGDMSYYITALSQFKDLRECAQGGVSSAYFTQTDWRCPAGPQALASCICLKSGVSNYLASSMTSEVKYSCDSTATDDVNSALAVLDYYCSAANKKVVATVSESISQTTVGTGGIPNETGGSGSGGGSGSDDGNGGDDNNNSDGSDSSDGNDDGGGSGGGGSSNNTAVIAASVLGGLVFIALVVGLVWFMRRRSAKRKLAEQNAAAAAAAGSSGPTSGGFTGYPELVGSQAGTPRPGTGKDGLSPSSGHSPYPPPPELHGAAVSEMPPSNMMQPELSGTPAPGYAVPYGHGHAHSQSPSELSSPGHGYQGYQSQQQQQQQIYSHGGPGHGVVSPASPLDHGQQGMGWQSGPVETYELDGNMRR